MNKNKNDWHKDSKGGLYFNGIKVAQAHREDKKFTEEESTNFLFWYGIERMYIENRDRYEKLPKHLKVF